MENDTDTPTELSIVNIQPENSENTVNPMYETETARARYIREKMQEEDEWRKLNPPIRIEENAIRTI